MSRVDGYLAVLAVLAVACSRSPQSPADPGIGKADDAAEALPASVPTRVIWLIGDGMGVAQISAAAYANGDPLAMLSMPEVAFVATHEHEYATTDSAAAATAMASGIKTHFEGIGVMPGTSKDDEEDDTHHLETVIDVAQSAGWRTGLVATTSVVDATPAAFGAHRANRKSKADIALDLVAAEIDVLLGGGLKYFGDRSDGVDLTDVYRDRGCSVATTKQGLASVSSSATCTLGLFADSDMPTVVSGQRLVSLPKMTEEALEILDNDNDDGFFLMVEGSWIDRESHVMEGPSTVSETLDFDQAVSVALDYARQRDDTLVIVTADHETGGLAVFDADAARSHIDALGGIDALAEEAAFPSSSTPDPVQFVARGEGALTPQGQEGGELATSYGFLSVASRAAFFSPSFLFKATHTSTNVVLFAEGAGADYVSAVRDNADLGERVHRLVAADGEGGGVQEPIAEATPANLVLVVAEGVGLSSLTATQYARGDTAIASMSHRGLTTTHAADALVGDGASSASTLSTGTLATTGSAGIAGVDGLLALAENHGRRTALVTKAVIDDPSVVALYGSGGAQGADALIDFEAGDGVDIVFATRTENLTDADLDRWRERGVKVRSTWSSSAPDGDEQVARLLSPTSSGTLKNMTEQALDALADSGEPFVLVIHAGALAGLTRGTDRSENIVDAIAELDEVVAAALAGAASIGDTAVVVTSLGDSSLSVLDNHYGFHKNQCAAAARCGGDVEFEQIDLAIGEIHRGEGFSDSELQGDYAPLGIMLQYSYLVQRGAAEADLAGLGTANLVPVFAAGPGAAALRGFHLQTELSSLLRTWISAD